MNDLKHNKINDKTFSELNSTATSFNRQIQSEASLVANYEEPADQKFNWKAKKKRRFCPKIINEMKQLETTMLLLFCESTDVFGRDSAL